uniref:CRAL-TRIO domain-containing protein n=1 Tax=Timema tahoe TaxID=61484 RepID=A0A7R9P028_9NEOP|nr:unnamed protein product [Timema tahoe]
MKPSQSVSEPRHSVSSDPLIITSAEDVAFMMKSLGVDEKRMKEAVADLQEWIDRSPHLPKVSDPRLLCTLWFRRKCSIERAKESIDTYYSVRGLVPEFFENRNLSSPDLKQAVKNIQFFTMPRLSVNYTRVCIVRYISSDASLLDLNLFFKLMFMVGDIRLRECMCLGEDIIVDMSNITFSHVTKLTPVLVKKIQMCGMKGYSARMKSLHFINAPSFADTVVTLLKSIFSDKLASRIFVHNKRYDTLLEHISPEVLPKEFGGKAGSISDLWAAWQKKLLSYQDWYHDQEAVKVNEAKRPGKALNQGELFGVEGSFRKLTVD